jgi:hypothetical protein
MQVTKWSLWNLMWQGSWQLKNMAGGKTTTYIRKGKKVIFHLQPPLGLQIHLTLVCFSYCFGGGCRFLVREQEEVQGCGKPLLPSSPLHLQV